MSSGEAIPRVQLVETGVDPEDLSNWIYTEPNEAVERLIAGRSLLARNFDVPPTDLVDRLTGRLDSAQHIGPSALGGDAFDKISDILLRDGNRKSVIKGKEIRWVHDKWDLLSLVASSIWRVEDPQVDLLGQLISLHDRHCSRFGRDVTLSQSASRTEMERANLVFHVRARMLETTGGSSYLRVDLAWSVFYQRLQSLIDRVCSLVLEGLRDARIIAVQETAFGARFIGPSAAKLPSPHPRNPVTRFCLTSDLPDKWFQSLQELDVSRREATRFAEFVLEHFRAKGLRPTAADIQTAMQMNFVLSENAAKTAWYKVEPELRKGMSNVPRSQRVSLHEIHALHNTWRAN